MTILIITIVVLGAPGTAVLLTAAAGGPEELQGEPRLNYMI